MEKLTSCKSGACTIGAPLVTLDERAEFLPQIAQWRVVVVDGTEHLQRDYSFSDFVQALAFSNKIGQLAEEEGHHPAILTEWGSVKLSWWTHKINGLHKNDFILAAKSDQVYDAN